MQPGFSKATRFGVRAARKAVASTPRDEDGLVFPLLLGKLESYGILAFSFFSEEEVTPTGAWLRQSEGRAEGQV